MNYSDTLTLSKHLTEIPASLGAQPLGGNGIAAVNVFANLVLQSDRPEVLRAIAAAFTDAADSLERWHLAAGTTPPGGFTGAVAPGDSATDSATAEMAEVTR